MGGEKVNSRKVGKPPRAVAGKRKCAEPDCATILSRYNQGEYCHSCDRPTDDRMPPANRRS